MARKVSILDRIALAEGQAVVRPPQWAWVAKAFPTFLAIRNKVRVFPSKQGKLLSRRPLLKKPSWVWTFGMFAWLVGFVIWYWFILSPSQRDAGVAIYGAMVASISLWFVFFGSDKRYEDRRVAGARYIREFPVRRVLRSDLHRDASLASCREILTEREQHWLSESQKKRVSDQRIHNSPRQRFNVTLITFACTLNLLTPVLRGTLGSAAPLVSIVVMYAAIFYVFTSRKTCKNADAARRRGCCPDCGFSLQGLDRPAAFARVASANAASDQPIDIGPERCPECATAWPLVPPPTPAELLARRESAPPPA